MPHGASGWKLTYILILNRIRRSLVQVIKWCDILQVGAWVSAQFMKQTPPPCAIKNHHPKVKKSLMLLTLQTKQPLCQFFSKALIHLGRQYDDWGVHTLGHGMPACENYNSLYRWTVSLLYLVSWIQQWTLYWSNNYCGFLNLQRWRRWNKGCFVTLWLQKKGHLIIP